MPMYRNNILNKSERYNAAYDKFILWRRENNIEESISDNTLLQYFNELSRTMKPTSLTYCYSVLKGAIIEKHNINIQSYMCLKNFLKKQCVGFKKKKSKIFTAQEVDTFLTEAPDKEYLAVKVAFIFGVCGGISGLNFVEINTEHVIKHDEVFLVKLPPSRHMKYSETERAFVIRENLSPLIQKYIDLRPKNMQSQRFFVSYHNGQCVKQHIGKNVFTAMPKTIAEYLNLPEPNGYTGHCFRRTSQKLRSCTGSELALLKKLGGTKKAEVTEGQSGAIHNVSIMDSIDPVLEMLEATTSRRNEDLSQPYNLNQQSGNEVRIKALQLWEQLTEILNNGTVERSENEHQWRKVWADLKITTIRKVQMLNQNNAAQLTDFDQGVLKIIEKEMNTKEGGEWNRETDPDQTSNHSLFDTENFSGNEDEPNEHLNAQSTSANQNKQLQHENSTLLAKWKTFLNDKDGLFEAKPADNESDDEPLVKNPKLTSNITVKTEFNDRKRAKINGPKITDDRKRFNEKLDIERDRIRLREAELQLQGKWNELMMEGMRVLHKYLD